MHSDESDLVICKGRVTHLSLKQGRDAYSVETDIFELTMVEAKGENGTGRVYHSNHEDG